MDISSPIARQLSDEELRKKLLTTRASTGVMEKPFYETPANAGDVVRANPIEYFVNEPMDKINTPQAVAPATRQAAMGRPQNPAAVKPIIPPAESEMLTKPQISVYGNQAAPVAPPADMPTPVSTQRQLPSRQNLTPDTVISPVTKPTETTPPSTPKTDGGSISDYYDLIGKALITFGPAMFAKLTGDPNMAAAWGGGQAGLKANLDIDNQMYDRKMKQEELAKDKTKEKLVQGEWYNPKTKEWEMAYVYPVVGAPGVYNKIGTMEQVTASNFRPIEKPMGTQLTKVEGEGGQEQVVAVDKKTGQKVGVIGKAPKSTQTPKNKLVNPTWGVDANGRDVQIATNMETGRREIIPVYDNKGNVAKVDKPAAPGYFAAEGAVFQKTTAGDAYRRTDLDPSRGSFNVKDTSGNTVQKEFTGPELKAVRDNMDEALPKLAELSRKDYNMNMALKGMTDANGNFTKNGPMMQKIIRGNLVKEYNKGTMTDKDVEAFFNVLKLDERMWNQLQQWFEGGYSQDYTNQLAQVLKEVQKEIRNEWQGTASALEQKTSRYGVPAKENVPAQLWPSFSKPVAQMTKEEVAEKIRSIRAKKGGR